MRRAATGRDDRIDDSAAEYAKAREGSFLVRPSKPGVSDDVGDQDRRQFADFTHGCSTPIGERDYRLERS